MKKAYKSEIFAAVHELAEGLHRGGHISKRTMREFDESCLTPAVPFAPEELRALREREMVSQSVFARHLSVSKNLLSDWERGIKRPGGPALRLLTIVRNKGLEAIV